MSKKGKAKSKRQQANIKMRRIYFGLIIVSVGLFLVGIKANSTVQNILFSFAINMLASLIIIFSVDFNIDKKAKQAAERQVKESELRQINICHRAIEPILEIYILEYNQLLIPISMRTENGKFLPIKQDKMVESFNLSDLKDALSFDITVCDKLGNSVLETYNVVYKKTVDAFSNMLAACECKYYQEVEEAVLNIVKLSHIPNSIDTLCAIRQNEEIMKLLRNMLDSYTGNPDDDLKENKYSGNLFINYLLLYRHLTCMRAAINQYYTAIEEANRGAESEI